MYRDLPNLLPARIPCFRLLLIRSSLINLYCVHDTSIICIHPKAVDLIPNIHGIGLLEDLSDESLGGLLDENRDGKTGDCECNAFGFRGSDDVGFKCDRFWGV